MTVRSFPAFAAGYCQRPSSRIDGKYWLLAGLLISAAGSVSAQSTSLAQLRFVEDTTFIRQHHLKSIRIRYKDLRSYHGLKKDDKHWHLTGQYKFNRDGTIYSYRLSGSKSKQRYALSNYKSSHQIIRNSLGQLLQWTFTDGDKVLFSDTYEYNDTGYLQRILRAEPKRTTPLVLKTYQYNERGQEIEQLTFKSAAGYAVPGQRLRFYDAQHQLRASVLRSFPCKECALPTIDSLYYDAHEHVIMAVDYSPRGYEATSKMELGSRTRTEYDAAGRKTRELWQGFKWGIAEAVATWTYNEDGNPVIILVHDYTNPDQAFNNPYQVNHFKQGVGRYDQRGLLVEDKQYSAEFIVSAEEIKPKDLVEVTQWKPKYYR